MSAVLEAAHDRQVCRECRDGKHRLCFGDAWNWERDEPAICDCWKHGHEETP